MSVYRFLERLRVYTGLLLAEATSKLLFITSDRNFARKHHQSVFSTVHKLKHKSDLNEATYKAYSAKSGPLLPLPRLPLHSFWHSSDPWAD